MIVYIEWISKTIADDESGSRFMYRLPRDEIRFVGLYRTGDPYLGSSGIRDLVITLVGNVQHSITGIPKEISLQIYNDLTRHDVDVDVTYRCEGGIERENGWMRTTQRPSANYG